MLDSPIVGVGWRRIAEVGVEVFVRGGWINDVCISGSVVVGGEVGRGRVVVVGCAY